MSDLQVAIAVAAIGLTGLYLSFREGAIYSEILYRASEHGSRPITDVPKEVLQSIGREVSRDLRFWPFGKNK